MEELTDLPWAPPGMNETELQAFLSFEDGLPVGMEPMLFGWVQRVLVLPRASYSSPPRYNPDLFLRFQLQMNHDFGWPLAGYYLGNRLSDCWRSLSEVQKVYFLDFLLAHARSAAQLQKNLEETLLQGRSNWAVGTRQGRLGLISRIPSAVANAVEFVTSDPTTANNLLRRAWAQAYGVTPDPPAAYSSAVKAVEVYSTKIFNPRTERSTLGKDIAAFRAKPEKWDFSFGEHDSKNHGHLLGMMSLLWNNQSDRHGSEEYKDVTVDQARAAVLLASTLVGWFDQGLVELKAEFRN